jgi:hypothetical protein
VTPSLGALLSEGRKYGLGLTLAHQTLAQLDSVKQVAAALLGNAYARVVFRVGGSDARQLADGFCFFASDDIERLARGQAIVRVGGKANDCNLVTSPLSPAASDDAAARTAEVIALSRAQFATPIAELKATLAEWYRQKEPKTQTAEPIPAPRPESVEVPDVRAPSESPDIATRAKPKRAPPPDLPSLGRGGTKHKYLQHLIKRLAEERGFRAVIEDAAGDGRADIVLRKDKLTIGCEISVTTSVEQEVANLTKCLRAKFDHILFVCADARRREKVRAALASVQPDVQNVIFLGPDDVVTVLDRVDPATQPTEATIRGYKVKVSRQSVSASDITARRSAVAEVIARSLSKGSKA